MTQQTVSGWATYKRLARYVKPYALVFILALVASGLFSGVDLVLVKGLQLLIDEVFSGTNPLSAALAPFALILLIFLRGVFNVISNYCMAWVGNRVVMDIRNQLFSHVLRLPVSYFDQASTGELIAKVTYNSEKVMQALSSAITTLAKEGILVFGALLWCFLISWKLTLVFLITSPLIAFAASKATKRFRKVSTHIQTAIGDVSSVSEEAIEGSKVVKTFNGYEYEEGRFHRAANQNRLGNVKLILAKSSSVAFIQVIAGLGFAFVLWFAIAEVNQGHTSTGELVQILSYLGMLLKPIKQLTNVNTQIQQAIAAGESIFKVLDLEQEKDTGAHAIDRAQGHLTFDHVNFSYPNTDSLVLKDISFDLQPGKTLALVGRSGSGKTSITQLVLRFYQQQHGDITLDGKPISEYKLNDFRQQIALVGQHVALFNDTIARNIAYANPEATEADIIAAAKAAHAWEFIQLQPEGLDTMVGENGLKLSGGQRQRIAIARAILKKAPILILDEATSALDTESERYIQDALDNLLQDTTAIVVAHRLSTIEKADQILVMEQGNIVEQGSHQELLQQQGEYFRLYNMQFSEG